MGRWIFLIFGESNQKRGKPPISKTLAGGVSQEGRSEFSKILVFYEALQENARDEAILLFSLHLDFLLNNL